VVFEQGDAIAASAIASVSQSNQHDAEFGVSQKGVGEDFADIGSQFRASGGSGGEKSEKETEGAFHP
jgi:hypothetical protein